MRDSFIFYKSFYDAIRDLPRDVQGEIYTAIMEYSLYGNEIAQLKPIAKSIFILIKPQLDSNIARYENGKKGGRPRGQNNQNETEQKPNQNQNETNPKPNYNVNVNDNVNVLDKSNNTRTRAKIDLSYVSSEYQEAFTKWLEYKKARKESYKSAESVKECYNKLLSLSGNNPAVADAIVRQSMANNWAGLFELKQKSNNGNNTSQDRKHFGASEGISFTPRTDIEI